MLLATLSASSLIGFLIFAAILGVVAWAITKIPLPDFVRYIIWAIFIIFFLLMVYDLFTGSKTVSLSR